ncbi:MAG: sce7726 family protein [Alphaproteobacteria bacterium]|nr:sce7726 family protein [Alphaproteobacteria bacterium]
MEVGQSTGEQRIRSALHDKYLRRLSSRGGTLVLDELGLVHARSRIDIAVINRHVHGYEIKSAHDSLRRLPCQLEVYRQSLQTLTLVVDATHFPAVSNSVPYWCGIIRVTCGPRGAIRFHRVQRTRLNPELDPLMLAHLLWRREVQAALAQRGTSARDLRASRIDLYRMLLEKVSVDELTALIRRSMSQRSAWRGRPQPSLCGG